jgi:AAA+ superfamily predicted ATPase
MSAETIVGSTVLLRDMILKAAEGMHLGDRIIPSNAALFNDFVAFEEFAAQLAVDPEGAIGMLADLNIEVDDEAEWIDHYVRLAGSAYRLEYDVEEDALLFPRRPIHHPVARLLSTPPEWRSVRRAIFVYLRTQLFAARRGMAEDGCYFHSMELADIAELTPEEEDVLALLLWHSLYLQIDCEGRDILDFLSSSHADLLRHITLLEHGCLIDNRLILRESGFRGRQNILRDDFKLSEFCILKWAGILGRAYTETEPLESPHTPNPEIDGPVEAAGIHSGHLTAPEVCLEDVVLTEETKEQIEFAIVCAKSGVEGGGFLSGTLFNRGQATILLLHGPPGTGKTLVAEAIAHELERPLLRADWGTIGSPYMWQAEMNLGATFHQAQEQGAVLLVDEVDMLTARSDEVSGGQQQINRMTNVLLVALESAPEGSVIILCTNRAEALDPAIDRRLTVKLCLGPAETEEQRTRLWVVHLKDLPLESEVDETCLTLARSYPELSHGGHIKQVVMTAVRRAMAAQEKETLPLIVLKEAAEKIINQLNLKSKRRMGFST